MESRTTRLDLRPPFDADHLGAYFALRAVAGVEAVEPDVLRRTLRLPHGPGSVELALAADHVEADLVLTDGRDHGAAVIACRALLDLDADPAVIAAALADAEVVGPLVRAAPGRRSPGSTDAFEILIRAIVGQQVSLAAARTVLGRLTAEYGEPFSAGHPGLGALFPTPARLAEADPGTLPMPAARARAITRAAAAIAGGDLVLAGDGTYERLLTLPGVGPWTASYVAMRGLGDPDVFMAGDLGVRHALTRLGAPSAERAARELAAAWRPWRSYATHHLWAAVSTPSSAGSRDENPTEGRTDERSRQDHRALEEGSR